MANSKQSVWAGFKCALVPFLFVLSGAVCAEDANALLDARIQAYMNSPAMASLRTREAAGDVYVGYEIADVDVGPEHPEWAKHRAIAYEKALAMAQDTFVVNSGVEIASNTIRSLFADGSIDIPAYKKEELKNGSMVNELLQKVLAVAGGKLDKKLEEMGIDPKEFKSLPPKQRVTKLKDSIEKNAVKKAVGSLVGLFPIKTFEGKTARGEHAIGVVIAYSPTMRQFAYDVLHGLGTNTPATGKGGKSLLDQLDKERIFADFGIRRMYDETGQPVLVSFGQWAASSRSQDPQIRRKFEGIALEQARNLADGAIATFLGGSENFEDASTAGSNIEQHFDVDHTGFVEEVIVKQILDTIRRQSRVRAKIHITGLSDLYRWTMKYPGYNQTLIGVVRVWSPASERRARAIKNWKPARGKQTGKSPSAPIQGQTEVIDGGDYMSPGDL